LIFAIVVFAALVFLGLMFVFQPMAAGQRARQRESRDALLLEKKHALLLLRDLEFDYQTGKLSEADYRSSREEVEGSAIEILKRLDRVEELPGGSDQDLEREIERVRAQLRREAASAAR
jgi:hypothetical protein